MKNIFTAFILGIALAGFSLAQTTSEQKSGKGNELKMAVVEFSPKHNATAMMPEAKRQLQTHLAAALAKTDKFDVADIRWTRNESQDDLAEINGGNSTAAAVKLGKTLGVSYVLTGTVTEYTAKGADGFGSVTLKARIIEVSTGKVKFTGDVTQRSTSELRTTSVVEVQTKTIKPALLKLAAKILESEL